MEDQKRKLMDEMRSIHIIQSLQKKWSVQILLAHLLSALAITFFASAIAITIWHVSWIVAPVILIISVLLIYFLLVKKISEDDVTKFLNQAFPELQESTHLVLKPYNSLNVLEKLQVKKVEHKLNNNFPSPPVVKKKIKTSSLILAIALIASFALFIIPFKHGQKLSGANSLGNITNPDKPETKLPQVEAVRIKITPPAYTRKGRGEQDRFNIVAEEDADVNWTIITTIKVNDVQLIFNDKSVLHLKKINNEQTKWLARKPVKSSGFYQVKIAGNLSELYKIEMIKDQPPVIIIQSPKPNTIIEFGQPQKVTINVSLSDDYGIDSSSINATTASGSGEAVKFKEQQLPFSNFKNGNRKYQLQKQIDLAALGMQPGDELYFYVKAKDTYHQEKRSDVYIIRMEDTAQLMSIEGLVNGVDLKPEFFRSERQIIIETEQLIKDKDTISVEVFNKKNSDLGIDQKLLRMRYGKFLGEENESEIGEDHDHHSAQSDPADFNNADKILDQYSHKHDNAEDATFFDAKTKKQLLAALTEMWNAELQLRTYKPKEALPFEYKALRLLKDLQQQTRAYVAKAGFKTTPLKPETRLTGDLTKISEPVTQQNFQQKKDQVTILRKALGVLEQLRNKEALQKSDVQILEQASMQLSRKAAFEPSAYLAALEALKRIQRKDFKSKDIDLSGSAFQKMIKVVSNIPQQSKAAPDMELSKRYFKNLKNL